MLNIRTRYLLALVVAASLAVAGCASEVVEAPAVEPAAPEASMTDAAMEPDTPEASEAEPETPITEGPREFGVGTVRTYNYSINGESYEIAITIAEKQDYEGRAVDLHAFSAPLRDPGGPCHGATHVLEDLATANFAVCMKDGNVLGGYSPSDGRFKWPLQVGDSWRARYQWIDKAVNPEWSGRGWQRFSVVAWEEVTVPAGTFMAYKVARTNGDWDTVKEENYVIWYAPEPGLIVKLINTRSPRNGYGASDQGWELVTHDLK